MMIPMPIPLGVVSITSHPKLINFSSLKTKTDKLQYSSFSVRDHKYCSAVSTKASNHDHHNNTVMNSVPRHVAVIMDGNRRWAKSRKLPLEQHGHTAGSKALIQMAINCSKLGVKILTVFAFSTENWTRTKGEVDFLMMLFEELIESDQIKDLRTKYDVQVSVIGDKSALPLTLQAAIASVEKSTKSNKGMQLILAVNYGGRYDITRASKIIATKVRDSVLQVEEIDENIFQQHLGTSMLEFPNPDLLIRTSGEKRFSNFLMWQLAYSELYFCDKMFPDFDMDDLVEAFKVFQERQKRI